MFHHQTWYEKWFGARLISPLIRKRYHQAIQIFYDPEAKETREYFEQFLKKLKLDTSSINDVLNIYDTTTTYKQFFDKIRETFHPPIIYGMIKPWLNAFIERLGLGIVRTEPWVISCSNHNFTGYSIHSLEHDPFNGNYIFVTRKQTGGGHEKKTLSNADKYSLQMPNWIGWLHIIDDEYCDEDQEYLKMLRARLFGHVPLLDQPNSHHL